MESTLGISFQNTLWKWRMISKISGVGMIDHKFLSRKLKLSLYLYPPPGIIPFLELLLGVLRHLILFRPANWLLSCCRLEDNHKCPPSLCQAACRGEHLHSFITTAFCLMIIITIIIVIIVFIVIIITITITIIIISIVILTNNN